MGLAGAAGLLVALPPPQPTTAVTLSANTRARITRFIGNSSNLWPQDRTTERFHLVQDDPAPTFCLRGSITV